MLYEGWKLLVWNFRNNIDHAIPWEKSGENRDDLNDIFNGYLHFRFQRISNFGVKAFGQIDDWWARYSHSIENYWVFAVFNKKDSLFHQ